MQVTRNLDLINIVTPVQVDKYEELLINSGYDPFEIKFLNSGCSEGFNLNYMGDEKVQLNAPNLKL